MLGIQISCYCLCYVRFVKIEKISISNVTGGLAVALLHYIIYKVPMLPNVAIGLI